MQISDNRDKILLFLYKTLDPRKSLLSKAHWMLWPPASAFSGRCFWQGTKLSQVPEKKKKESDAGSTPSDLNERCSRKT